MSPIRLLWITPPAGALDVMGELLPARSAIPGLAILLRRPGAEMTQLLGETRWLQSLSRSPSKSGARVPVLVQRVDVALATSAAGVHLPERGLPVAEARRLLPHALVGASRHERKGLEAAQRAGANYATLSPFAETPGKGPALGAERFASTSNGISMPILALGGIDDTSGAAALSAGADGFAFIRAGLDRASFDALHALLA